MFDRFGKCSIRGFTMVEMLVAMAIVGVFLTIFIAVVMATFQTLRTGDERTVAQQNARIAIRFIVKDLKQAVRIAPRRLEEPYDPVTLGLPRDQNSKDQFDPVGARDAYPIFRRTTDGDDIADGTNGFIDLSHLGVGGDDEDEYDFFRPDGKSFDVRPLAPNRLELLLNADSFYSHTEYWGLDPADDLDVLPDPYDLDIENPGGSSDNPQALQTRVTYEHQIAPPKNQIYVDAFDGNEKRFKLPVNRNTSRGVTIDEDFCLVRSSETEFFEDALNSDVTIDSELDPDLNIDSYVFMQPVADHIIDVRFRYWHVMPFTPDPLEWNSQRQGGGPISGNTPMIEIRYDPDITHSWTAPDGSSGSQIDSDPDDGYYRYFTPLGQEVYVWYDHDEAEDVEYVDPSLPDQFSPVNRNCFIMQEGPTGSGWEEYEKGVLLFEGWRFINMVSVTVRATNRENLNKYKSTIDHSWTNRSDPDYQVGFVYFGKGAPPDGLLDPNLNNANVLDPFYRSVDTYRTNTVSDGSIEAWDFVEPNVNPNYDPGAFVTMEVFVVPPVLKALSAQMENLLTFGFAYKRPYD